MNNFTKLVLWQCVAIIVTVGLCFLARALGVSEKITHLAVAAVAFVAMIVVVEGNEARLLPVMIVLFVIVTSFAMLIEPIPEKAWHGFPVIATSVFGSAFAAAFALIAFHDLNIKYPWALVTLVIEVVSIAVPLTIGGANAGCIAAIGIVLLILFDLLFKSRALRTPTPSA